MGKITAVYSDLKQRLLGEQPIETDPLQRRYFTVFSSPDGRLVLADILQDLHAFGEIVNEEDIALNNYSRLLLAKIGIIQGETATDIVNALMPLAKAVAVK